MSLKEEIAAASEKEIEEIISSAKEKAEEIRHAAKVKAVKDFCEAQNHTDRRISRDVRIIQSEAEMKCRAEWGQALEELLKQLKEKITDSIKTKWKSGFEEIIIASIIRGAEKIKSDEVMIELPETFSQLFAAKEQLIRTALAEKQITIINEAFTLRSACGIVISNKEGRKLVTDTAEENIRRIEDELRMTLAERIGYGG